MFNTNSYNDITIYFDEAVTKDKWEEILYYWRSRPYRSIPMLYSEMQEIIYEMLLTEFNKSGTFKDPGTITRECIRWRNEKRKSRGSHIYSTTHKKIPQISDIPRNSTWKTPCFVTLNGSGLIQF